MKPLAFISLDLGTKCGWAVGVAEDDRFKIVESGMQHIRPKRHESPGVRLLKLADHLNHLHGKYEIALLGLEEVHAHRGVGAAHIYGALLGKTQEWAAERGVTVSSYGVGTIKKSWTGKGNASKESMKLYAEVRGFKPIDDNEADALAIAHLMHELHGLPDAVSLHEIAAAHPP